ncbi:hypothetical protein AC482_02930 [miscellaneous Crenarchaeota group-15 archaeon DG-45]|uniref:DNA alkylation repair protein n=1 Tax=miscellaneous Crenarchaeota group-15 archaeon DG-45 TaxID=1685127 RepID=A0A0M0BR05_9ARCH|nr:MAG: hypothetical protein AC482_02930 [miscellaneous Crenarchaeota group-15 archaeon DG-45]
MSGAIVDEIRADILRRARRENVPRIKRFFKEAVEVRGLMSPQIEEVAKLAYPMVREDLNLALEVAGRLVASGVLEEASVGIRLLGRMTGRFTPELFDVFDGWVDRLTNWATTDGLCTSLISETVTLDPELAGRLLLWTGSEGRWRRRAAAVSLVPLVRKGLMLDEAFAVAERLMTDGDEMVQKGVGWLLKEAAKGHPHEVRGFLLRWRAEAPALVLRYASEKLPGEMKVLKTR